MAHRRSCDLSIEDRIQIMRQSDIGNGGLNPALLTRLATAATVVEYRRRRFIYRAGEQGDAVYVIAKGRVKLCSIEEKSTVREAVIDILSSGALFGESALYKDGMRELSAVAYENSRLLRISADEFRRTMIEHNELYDYTFRLLGQRLSGIEKRVVNFALDSIPTRLDKLLVELSTRFGVNENGGVLIDLPLPHREIASIVGSTRESVTVRLNAMRREGIIEIVNRRILIKRPEILAAA
jgi:CRP/FNR family transcriptional regulator, cyclic AMP receptor protein